MSKVVRFPGVKLPARELLKNIIADPKPLVDVLVVLTYRDEDGQLIAVRFTSDMDDSRLCWLVALAERERDLAVEGATTTEPEDPDSAS